MTEDKPVEPPAIDLMVRLSKPSGEILPNVPAEEKIRNFSSLLSFNNYASNFSLTNEMAMNYSNL